MVGPFKRMRFWGSNDTNTYNLYICLFTVIFLDNRGSLIKIWTENELKASQVKSSQEMREKKGHPRHLYTIIQSTACQGWFRTKMIDQLWDFGW